MRSRAFVAALTTAVLCAAGLAPAEAAPSPGLSWRPCAQDSSLDCARLRVPVDWANPRTGTITLDVSRQKAAKPAQRVGVLVLIGSQPLANPSQALKDRFDLVTYSARQEETCTIALPGVPFIPTDDAELEEVRSGMRDWYLACAEQVGPVFQHDNSAIVARDVDAVRAALGERRISLMHTWENEIVGQMYAELFPRRIRAMVLDGNLDHSARSAVEYLGPKAAGVQATFDGFADWCDRTPSCVLHGMDTRKVYDELRDRADRGELGPITAADLSGHVGFAGDYPHRYFGPLAEHYLSLYRGSGPDPVTTTGFRRGLSAGSFCQDWNLPITSYSQLTEILRAQDAAAPNTRINLNQWLNVLGCVGWPFEVGNPTHELRISAKSLPVLVVNAYQAPGQPAAWADSVARQIPGAAHLVYEGPGTLAYQESPCVRAHVDAFLITLAKPRVRTCAGLWPSR
ncbi:alpha/beta hydrolase [Umezawaea sp. NPDC059074]|uniref:alpha/beta hydrolase n=1 Tax=Umezawaea sp. NPDC059074 TaxID=3346716 RepID=UPI00368626CF